MDEESIKRLLSGCPVREDLGLSVCGGKNVSVVSISAPALKRLMIGYPLPKCWETSINYLGYTCTQDVCPYEIELNAPSLLHFEYSGLVAEGFAMNNLSSLVEASINFEICDEQDGDYTSMTDLLHGISHVRTLHIYCDCIETLWNYGGLRLPVFRSLTTLELGGKRGLQWELLPNLLEWSPNLRTLGFEKLDDYEYYDDDNSEVWYPPEHVPTCLLVSLEKIDMGIFRGQQCELKVVEYFLTNAKVLKIVHIWFDHYQMRLERSGYEYEVFRKLLEMPRGSTSCKVLVS